MENGAAAQQGDHADPVQEARDFIKSRDALRERLQTELRSLLKRVSEVRLLLSELEPKPTQPAFDPSKATVAGTILHIVQTKAGLPIGSVVNEVLRLKPTIKRSGVYPVVYKLRDEARDIGVAGDRYYPKGHTALQAALAAKEVARLET